MLELAIIQKAEAEASLAERERELAELHSRYRLAEAKADGAAAAAARKKSGPDERRSAENRLLASVGSVIDDRLPPGLDWSDTAAVMTAVALAGEAAVTASGQADKFEATGKPLVAPSDLKHVLDAGGGNVGVWLDGGWDPPAPAAAAATAPDPRGVAVDEPEPEPSPEPLADPNKFMYVWGKDNIAFDSDLLEPRSQGISDHTLDAAVRGCTGNPGTEQELLDMADKFLASHDRMASAAGRCVLASATRPRSRATSVGSDRGAGEVSNSRPRDRHHSGVATANEPTEDTLAAAERLLKRLQDPALNSAIAEVDDTAIIGLADAILASEEVAPLPVKQLPQKPGAKFAAARRLAPDELSDADLDRLAFAFVGTSNRSPDLFAKD